MFNINCVIVPVYINGIKYSLRKQNKERNEWIMRKKERVISLMTVLTLTGSLVLGGCAKQVESTEAPTTEQLEAATTEQVEEAPEYIASSYTIDEGLQGPTEYFAPVFYENEGGPTIGVTLVGVISEEGKYFKDSNNNKELDVFEDWRQDTDTRVADLLTKMNTQQHIGLLENQLACSPTALLAEDVYDANGKVILSQLITVTEDAMNMPADLADAEGKSLRANSTGEIITFEGRSGVLRETTDAETGALWANAVNMTTEYAAVAKNEPTIPFTIISNPQNVIGIPNSMGVAAAAIGDVEAGGDYSVVERYADIDGQIWNAKGISRMYGPQIDLITDPRWGRNVTTYTEDPEVMAGIATALVKGYQNDTNGAQDGDVALIMKHFPGDGAAYNGFESHFDSGKWRVYQTEGSLEKYQLVGFQAAIDAGLAGIMPGYSMEADAGTYGTVVQSYRGLELDPELIANAYNPTILQTLLRDTMGFEGFVNTDSTIITGAVNFGAEDMTEPERVATAINAGSDVIGDAFGGPNWDNYTLAIEQGLLTEEAINRANTATLSTLMDMGQFENPYKDVEESKATVDGLAKDIAALSTEMNQKSVVLMKNHNDALPLKDTSKKVYIASFTHEGENEEKLTEIKTAFETAGYTLVEAAGEADIAFLDVVPGGVTTKNAFISVLDLVDELEVLEVNYPDDTTKTGDTVDVTTLADVKEIAELSETVHANGGIVIASVTITSPWILTNLEPYCDGLIGAFGTNVSAQMDVLTGTYNPTGKLPITMISCAGVIAVEEKEVDGIVYEICVSPNDVPGFEKDQYMAEDVLAQSPSGSYAYQDADGNVYAARFGLSYK